MINVKIKDVELTNIHIAVGAGLLFGVGVACGWMLTIWGIF
jgi:hypothetical protein